ncbi:MAG: hypothetical protein ACXAC7_05650, partial [Candidatus Hodarchaeales archaeon]
MFDIINTDPLILFLIFPGLIFIILGVLLWLNFSYIFLLFVEETPNITLQEGFQHFLSPFIARNTRFGYTYGIPWLVLRFTSLIMCYFILLASFFISFTNDFILVLFIFLIASFFNLGYEFNNSKIRYGSTYALYELFNVNILIFWALNISEFDFFKIRQNPWTHSLENQIFQIILLILFIISLGRVSSYQNWVKVAPLLI